MLYIHWYFLEFSSSVVWVIQIFEFQAKGNKKQTVQLVVSSNGIQVFDPRSSQLTGDISIHR